MDRFTTIMVALGLVACFLIIVITFATISAVIGGFVALDNGSPNSAGSRDGRPARRDPGSSSTRVPSKSGRPSISGNNDTAVTRPGTSDPFGGVEQPDKTNSGGGVSGQPPEPVDPNRGIRMSPFIGMSDEQKNFHWWEIACAARRSGEDSLTFSLDNDTARQLARRFDCAPVQLMDFFRQGATADWRQDEPD